MDNNIVIIPFENLRELINNAVSESLDKILAASQPKREQESVDIDGALEFLNSNGYRIAKGQLYKETSAGNIPFHKFGHLQPASVSHRLPFPLFHWCPQTPQVIVPLLAR